MTEMPLDAAALDVYDALLRAVVICPRQEDHERVSAQARAALTLRDELAALVGELAECRAKLATASDMNATLARDNELLSRKLARAEQERDDLLSSLRSAEQDGRATVGHMGTLMIAAAAAQAENVRLREAARPIVEWQSDCGWGIEMFVECKNEMIALKNSLATPPGSRAALREMLTEAFEEGETNMDDSGERYEEPADAVSRLLPEEGGQS